MKLLCGLVIKDGIEFIQRYLDRHVKLFDGFVVVDNDSKDGTSEIIIKHPAVLAYLLQRDLPRHMGRDYQKVNDMCASIGTDYIIMLDHDELIDERTTRDDFNKLMERNETGYCFDLYEMRSNENTYIQQRNVSKMYKYDGSPIRQDIHSRPIPESVGMGSKSGIKIKHYGHYTEEIRTKKRKMYEASDDNIDRAELMENYFREAVNIETIMRYE